jgi:FecR protein
VKTSPFLFLLALSALVLSVSAEAVDASCKRENLPDPPRVVYRCANGLVLEAEAAADLRLSDAPAETRPNDATIARKAVLIEVEPGSGAFQILTPQAIAAVRGTAYIVDVEAEKTSVFVMRGKVAVSKADGSETTVLQPGEGADISAGKPIISDVWGQERAKRLLSRFAR